jgi:hypothetical protein
MLFRSLQFSTSALASGEETDGSVRMAPKFMCSKPSSNARGTLLETGAFGESALDELNISWD